MPEQLTKKAQAVKAADAPVITVSFSQSVAYFKELVGVYGFFGAIWTIIRSKR